MPNRNEFQDLRNYKYLIYKISDTYYALHHAANEIDQIKFFGTDACTVIRNALNNLTLGRTWKETVILHGDITLAPTDNTAAAIPIPSYTCLVIDGRLRLADNATCSGILKNKNADVSVDSNIEICGGIIDGNESGSANGHCIFLKGVTDSSIHDITVKNAGGASGRNIYITTPSSSLVSQRILLKNIITDNATDSNVELGGSTTGADDVTVNTISIEGLISTNAGARCLALTNARKCNIKGLYADTAGSRCIDFSYHSCDNTLANSYLTGATLDGVTMAASPGASTSDRNNVINTIICNCTAFGVNIAGSDNNVSNCLVYGNGQDGFRVTAARNTLIGNECKNNGQSAANTYQGMDIRAANIVVMGNTCYDDQGVKTQRFGMSFNGSSSTCIVIGNNVSGNLQTKGISDSGNGNIVRNNAGFVTEASGTATVANGATTTTVTHGLGYTPSLNDITVTPTNSMGNATKFFTSNPTSSQFTINVNSDPGATTATFAWAVRRIS